MRLNMQPLLLGSGFSKHESTETSPSILDALPLDLYRPGIAEASLGLSYRADLEG